MRQAVAAIARFTVIGCHRLVKWPAEKWPLLARNRPPAMSAVWSLSGGKRTSPGQPNSVENDPKPTFGAVNALRRMHIATRHNAFVLPPISPIW